MSELLELLEAVGYDPRPAQTRLYDHLTDLQHDGVIAQAGTGTGKSLGILASAAHSVRQTGHQAIVVTPTLTLMNQYRDGDTPASMRAFQDLTFAEIRGMAHYRCEQSIQVQANLGIEHDLGCLGIDAGCSQTGWEGHTDGCLDPCEVEHQKRWECDYRAARYAASRSDVVVTNADMLIVNDRMLYPMGRNFLSLDGSLFVDEAHTLEQKLRDYASRSLWHGAVKHFAFAGNAGPTLARWIERQERQVALKDFNGFPDQALRDIAFATMPGAAPGDGLTKQREAQEACQRLLGFMAEPHENAVMHVGQGSLKMDWINISKSSGELLSTRRFGLVSATVPRTMAATLGVPDAPFVDVGHPFDYSTQAWIGFSAYGGDYRSAQHESNFEQRYTEVRDLINRSGGGALVLFSSFLDLEKVRARLQHDLELAPGIGDIFVQEREMSAVERQGLADAFKADGNAILLGSESFATGFDVPGDALRLVVIWKLPYPAVDPVSNAIRSSSYARYEDLMKVRAVQAIGRLIRRESDRGVVWLADARARKLLDPSDPLTSHIPQFARLP